jgi:hypothetical protein
MHSDLPGPPRAIRAISRTAIRVLLTIVGAAGGLFCYFVCQGMFSGYPQYDTNLLSYIGLGLIIMTGGVAWYVDERRSHDDDD